MFSKKEKSRPQRFAKTILALLFCVLPGCVAPDAVKTEIQGIRNDMGSLEKIVDQKADSTVVAEQVGEINNKIEQTAQIAEELSLWRKDVQAETINYSGAGWVVVGTGIMALIFVGAGLLLIRAFMKRGSLLTLITCAIQKVGKHSPDTVKAIKKQLKIETLNGGPFTEQDRKNLGNFAKKKGTFSEQE
ncbi:hypothetical protein LCGC14_0221450 [marine sediment metagenome]|uniref:Uncharacterized protein n=1 Tax=marine sediment metagenome TaxID=412755 RepID=A0A0F9UUX8_9ZZZZ